MNENALLYEYAVLRYVPRIEREEFINVGLMMMCKRRRWLRVAVSLDRDRLSAFDRGVDIESLRRQLAMFDASSPALADAPVEERFRWFSAVKSSSIQTSRPHPGLIPHPDPSSPAESLTREFDRLFATLVL
ncbi:MAG: DUF3037 domain-containing protein [[Clostridium] fimetarium]|nr:DUF3037 domain-containing protein [Alistipes timonensis]MCM1406016.1 DUF3037 domain-containing protein [[Clostridium] fimetarium]